MKSVSVVIPTSGRMGGLLRAIDSVKKQDYRGAIEIVIVASGLGEAMMDDIRARTRNGRLDISVIDVSPEITSSENLLLRLQGAAQIGFKRNSGIVRSSGELIAHLDDDNYWDASHVSDLAAAVESSQNGIAHSWRKLLWPDGSPFLEEVYPWMKVPDRACAQYVYAQLVACGVRIPGSPLVRDCFLSDASDCRFTVDTSEWMISADLARRIPFREQLSFRELSHWLTDDYMFCLDVYRYGIRDVGTTGRSTLNYTIGGSSTRWLLADSN